MNIDHNYRKHVSILVVLSMNESMLTLIVGRKLELTVLEIIDDWALAATTVGK